MRPLFPSLSTWSYAWTVVLLTLSRLVAVVPCVPLSFPFVSCCVFCSDSCSAFGAVSCSVFCSVSCSAFRAVSCPAGGSVGSFLIHESLLLQKPLHTSNFRHVHPPGGFRLCLDESMPVGAPRPALLFGHFLDDSSITRLPFFGVFLI